MTIVVAVLAVMVAVQYAFIGVYIVPRLARLADQPGPVIRAGQWGAAVFFIGCGLTHVGIAVHTLGAQLDSVHLLLVHVWPHVAQVLGGATFSYIAWKKLEVRFAAKGYEEERQRAERERERAAAQIALEARAEAERANRAKSEFLSRMSHELRTPLNAVLGFGQLLQMGSLDKRQAESVDQIVKGGRHLLDLIDEVLDISRIESGGLALSMESVDVAGLLGDVLALVKPMAAERGIELRAELQETTGRYVAADEQRLKQVLLNLLSNAIKYNCDDGAVTVTCDELAGERLRILVSDTGPGIAADKLDRVFTPFDRLGAERTTVEGTGLGLALSKRLTEAMGGNLTVESGPERGSAFAVELPLAEPPAPQHPGRVTNGQSDGARFGRRSLLYIEDNPSNFKLIEKLFESQGEVEVELAMQGELGIELAQQHRPDVIVLDLHLPDMSGAEVLARLQGEPRTADLPVIVLTADASPGQEERLRQAGARAYLTKPLDVQRFLAVVNDCLVDREASRSSERSASPRGDASPVISR